MKKEHWSLIFGFILLISVGYSLWEGGSFFISALVAVDPKISAAIIAAMTTIFVGLTAVIITQQQIKMREVEDAHRGKKVEIYDEFLKMVTSLIAGGNKEVSMKAPSQQELIDYLVNFKREIILWGSPEVIRCQLNFQRESEIGGDMFLAIDNLYKAIRKDIGLSNKGLNELQLVKMYLKDPDELDQLRASNRE